jgi:hypothetical protein
MAALWGLQGGVEAKHTPAELKQTIELSEPLPEEVTKNGQCHLANLTSKPTQNTLSINILQSFRSSSSVIQRTPATQLTTAAPTTKVEMDYSTARI